MRYVYKHLVSVIFYCLLPFHANSAGALQVQAEPKVFTLGLFYKPAITELIIKADNFPPGSNVVARIMGPLQQLKLYHKTKQWGVWLNKEPVTLHNIPFYYLIAASNLSDPEYEFLEPLNFSLDPFYKNDAKLSQQYLQELRRFKIEKGEYPADIQPLTNLGEGQYKLDIVFPKSLVQGNYKVEVYIVKDKAVLGIWRGSIEVQTSSFVRNMQDITYNHGWLTGILLLILVMCLSLLSRFILQSLGFFIKFKN